MPNSDGTFVPQNNSVKIQDSNLIYFEGDFYSRDQIRGILEARSRARRTRAKAYRRAQRKRKPILMFGLNTIKA